MHELFKNDLCSLLMDEVLEKAGFFHNCKVYYVIFFAKRFNLRCEGCLIMYLVCAKIDSNKQTLFLVAILTNRAERKRMKAKMHDCFRAESQKFSFQINNKNHHKLVIVYDFGFKEIFQDIFARFRIFTKECTKSN